MAQPEKNGRKSSKPKIITCEGLAALEEKIQKAIAYRAYELYESHGRSHGHDMQDWFNAERELVKPSDVQIDDAGGQLSLRATLPGISGENVSLGLSPRRLIIWGEAARPESRGGKIRLLGEIDLPAAVEPARATATVNNEVLEFQAPKEKPTSPLSNKS